MQGFTNINRTAREGPCYFLLAGFAFCAPGAV